MRDLHIRTWDDWFSFYKKDISSFTAEQISFAKDILPKVEGIDPRDVKPALYKEGENFVDYYIWQPNKNVKLPIVIFNEHNDKEQLENKISYVQEKTNKIPYVINANRVKHRSVSLVNKVKQAIFENEYTSDSIYEPFKNQNKKSSNATLPAKHSIPKEPSSVGNTLTKNAPPAGDIYQITPEKPTQSSKNDKGSNDLPWIWLSIFIVAIILILTSYLYERFNNDDDFWKVTNDDSYIAENISQSKNEAEEAAAMAAESAAKAVAGVEVPDAIARPDTSCFYVQTIDANVRSSIALTNNVLFKLKRNDRVCVLERRMPPAGSEIKSEWYRIEYNGRTGWMSSKILGVNEYVYVEPVTIAVDECFYVQPKYANLRSELSLDNNVITKVKRNTYVCASEKWVPDGMIDLSVPWYKVRVNNKQGWMSSKTLGSREVTTRQEFPINTCFYVNTLEANVRSSMSVGDNVLFKVPIHTKVCPVAVRYPSPGSDIKSPWFKVKLDYGYGWISSKVLRQ